MKKLIALTVLVSTLASAQTFKEPPLAQFAPEGGKITLEVWSWVPNLDKTAALFEKRYPNIQVKITNLGSGPATYTKLLTSLKAGSGAPDVAQIEYGFLPTFVDTGGLVDLNTLGADKVKNLFVPWTWSQSQAGSTSTWAIPQDGGPFAMMYNKTILDKYSVKVPTTWTEYAAAAEKLSKASGGKVKMGNFYATYAPWFMALVWADGGNFFSRSGDQWSQTFNSSSSKKVLSYWNDLIKKGYVSTLPAFTADYNNAVAKGEIATALEAAWGPNGYTTNAKNQAGQWRVADLPQWNKGGAKTTGNWGGSSNVVLKQSKTPKAAMLFAVWLNSSKEAVQANWSGATLFPVAKAGLTLLTAQEKANPGATAAFFGGQNILEPYGKAASRVNTNFQWAPWFTFANDNFNKQTDAMLKGTMTSDQALDAWQADSMKQAKNDGYNVK